jgi:nucleotide-binding universal stress UspA family protein
MVQIQRILCPVDFYPASERAVDYAVILAENYGSHLTLLHVVAPILPSAYGVRVDLKSLVEALKTESARKLRQLSKKAESAKVPVECIVRTGEIQEEIKRIVRSAKIDFVVMGTHGRRGIERWVLGSVAEQLLRSIRVPLLTIGRREGTEKVPLAIRRILITTDFSEGTSEAIAYAFTIAHECQAHISILHVLGNVGADTSEKYREILTNKMGDELEKLIPDEARAGCDVKTRVETGLPFKVILKALEKDKIDLLVMNVHGKRGLDRSLLDSTAERVVRAASCPVLMIPPIAATQRKRRLARKVA